MTVSYTIDHDVAVIAMDAPPVNGLGLALRQALVDAVQRANADGAVRAIVISGAGKVFSGGADIREFNSPQAFAEPNLPTLIAELARSSKPVVAAVQGIALGGGLELALGAHYRVVAAGTQIGLPEVKLGLLPGAGGTQRLPRAVGLESALQMIVSGSPVAAEKLASTRLIDQLTEAAPLAAAIELARSAADRGGPFPQLRANSVESANAAAAIAAARASLAASAPQLLAPRRCIDAVEASVLQDFESGLALERGIFAELLESTQSRALRHAFFSERAASKVADIGPDIKPRAIRSVAVIGAGTMGGGISMNFLNAGIPVHILENIAEALQRGVATIHANYAASARKGKLSATQVEQRMALLQPTLNYADLAQADLIIEAVFEEYSVKEGVFRQLDAVAKPGAILASNTSTLNVDRIAGFTSRPQDVIGTHFFSPANVMKLLELVRGALTAKDVLATALGLARTIGKTAVVSGVCDGFIGNRMIEQYSRQAGFLLDEGALPEQVDRAMEDFGFAMGPFRMGDLAGNDIGWAIRQRRYVEQSEMRYPKTADLICERGRYGQKTGAGWYDYRAGDRTAHPSVEVNQLIIEHSAALGLTRRAISDQEIVERLIYSLVNEAALILEEGIAAKASDIDVVYLSGYGFPAWRGGPMFYADEIGLAKVLSSIEAFAQGYEGSAWRPAPLLQKLAGSGAKFNG